MLCARGGQAVKADNEGWPSGNIHFWPGEH